MFWSATVIEKAKYMKTEPLENPPQEIVNALRLDIIESRNMKT